MIKSNILKWLGEICNDFKLEGKCREYKLNILIIDVWHKWEHWNTTLNNLKTWKYLFSVIHIEKED